LTLTIHRGTHEIGGSCIELATATTRIFLDFGLPLVDRQGNPLSFKPNSSALYSELNNSGIAPPIPYFKDRDTKPTFLLLSHSHLDHYGLSPWIPDDIPIYTSKGTKKLLEIAYFFGQSTFDPTRVLTMEPWKSLYLGDFNITPFLADHSAIDAFSFLIKADGKRVFYSGDLRSHGRKEILFQNLLTKLPKDIDYLILEGSTLGRETSAYETEQDVEKRLVNELGNKALYLASFSSQNIDRFVSFFKACRKTKRTLVVDPYTAYILDSIRPLSPNIPQYDWEDGFRVFNVPHTYTQKLADSGRLFKYKNAKITLQEIIDNPSNLVIKENYRIRKFLQSKQLLSKTRVIYSMWDGYLKGDNFWHDNGVPVIKIHCSGHAYKEDLVQLVEAIKPKQVIPNHTFYPNEFSNMFGEKTLLLQDGQVLEL